MNKKFFVWVLFLFFLFDRFSKEFVRFFLDLGDGFSLKLFSINHVVNTGSAFGLFKDNNLFFIVLSFVVLFLIFYYRNDFLNDKRKTFFVGLITAGVLGNLFDRLIYGAVIDFIDFHFWPVFNVADSCISVGVIVLIFLFWND